MFNTINNAYSCGVMAITYINYTPGYKVVSTNNIRKKYFYV